jgi:hypothetical protein
MRSKQPEQPETHSVQMGVEGESGIMPPVLRQKSVDRASSLKTIEFLLDYAILESAELSLPFVVCLLRMARLELGQSLEQDENTATNDGVH